MSDPSLDPSFIRWLVATYKDDFNGYRRDILGMKPAAWQDRVGNSLLVNKRTSVASGHGIGKTAFGASAIHWFIATRPNPAIVATSNTENQLVNKLWRELNKVNQGAKNRAWFDWKQKSFTAFNDPTSKADAISWSADNSEAFAGTHETHVLGVFDEASAIDRVIFNVFAGAMTTPGARWLCLGNSTRNEGYFYDATHGHRVAKKEGDLDRGMWNAFVIPSWESPFVDPAWVSEMKESLGEDSDEYRVRVAGLPPQFDAEQFIPRHFVSLANEREVEVFNRWPLILGVDIGSTGDRSIIVPRRGRVALRKGLMRFRGERTTDFARAIVEQIRFWREDEGLNANVIAEAVGMGVGVVETVEDMGYAENIWGINPGNTASEAELYSNLRCEMWALGKEWLEGEVSLPNEPELSEDLVTVKRKPSGTNSKLRLESKDEMRRRGVRSPDWADALMLTFAVPFDLLPEKRDMWRGSAQREGALAESWASN